MDFLLSVDTWLLLKLNVGVANSFFDWLMPIVTNLKYYRIPLAAGLVALVLLGGGKGRTAVLLLVVTVAVTDQLASSVLKPLIGRVRPCHVVEGLRAITGCGNTLSFPSGHATSSMAVAILLGLLYRRWLWVLIGYSVLISYSRVYIGVHYPSDILAGWIIGGGIAWGMILLYQRSLRKALERRRPFRPRWNTES
ncbi:MAG: phosphatase PAP2 family protein [candidate division Zixibacteria bacterium]|nr:phosphatase PAP2 family protein [candidate division Zixibacteria bacterium]